MYYCIEMYRWLCCLIFLGSIKSSLSEPDKLWLRYASVKNTFEPSKYDEYKTFFSNNIYCASSSRSDGRLSPLLSACEELSVAFSRMFEGNISITGKKSGASIVIEAMIDEYSLVNLSTAVSDEGFSIAYDSSLNRLNIKSNTGRGALYGAFHLINMIQRDASTLPSSVTKINVKKEPKSRIRIWELWDNMDGTVERGYGGRSIFHWEELPSVLRPRYNDYARFLASVGINAVSLTNVNSCYKMNQQLLNSTNIDKSAALGKIFAQYGIVTFLVPCFDSPVFVGKLESADPLNPYVIAWWEQIVAKIQKQFKDRSKLNNFIGFLFKADSEGMAGPSTYNRTEPEGSSMLANAVKQINGIIIWRAFTHPGNLGPVKIGDQPLMQFRYFMGLDGLWDESVVLQIKNGPMDFQTHEPVHSLFGNLMKTKIMVEFGVTQEYTGQAYHLCNLISQWESYLSFDTGCPLNNSGSALLADVLTKGNNGWGFAGVSNFGEGDFWTGNLLSSSNSFSYGRIAWDPYLSASDITMEWIELTFGKESEVVSPVYKMMMDSWYIYENYTSPFGLSAVDDNCAHRNQCTRLKNGMLADRVDHYYVSPWLWEAVGKPPNAGYGGGFNLSRREHMIGNNRSMEYGQTYCGINKKMFADPSKTPARLLLTFHHLPFDYEMTDGRSLIENVRLAYALGKENAYNNIFKVWETLKPFFFNTSHYGFNDSKRWKNVFDKLRIGIGIDAANFTETGLSYFSDHSKL